jgi:23S rRNA pseudouridine2605 synthase
VTVDGVEYGPVEARLDKEQGSNSWLTLGLREGKNREVKRVLEHLGLGVNRLIRISYGPFQLGILEKGKAEEVKASVLRDQLGRWMDSREEEPPKPRAAARPAAGSRPSAGPKPPVGPKPSAGPAPRHAPAPRRRPA